MKILCFGGNHPRHLYIMNSIHKSFPLSGFVVEKREHMVPCPPDNILEHDKKNFIRHFADRDKAEEFYFGKQEIPNCEIFPIHNEELNTKKTAEFAKKINPDVVFIFGCGIIKTPLYEALPKNTLNLHLGLSPKYRGAATLFWPFYFLEPTFAGSTFHYIVEEPDAGNVIHQTTPELSINDGIHDVACKTVIQSGKDIVTLLKLFQKNKTWNTFKQKGTGKNFLSNNFKPEHLRVIYDLFQNNLVEQYLNNNLSCKKPKLFRQF